MDEQAISDAVVVLKKSDLRQMVRLVRLLYRLSRTPAYQALIEPLVPDIARFDPGHDAVMMGYDFHVTSDGPRLIEVNTNAGGSLFALLAGRRTAELDPAALPARVKQKILFQFAEEFFGFTRGEKDTPARLVILDESPQEQFLYREMLFLADLLREWCGAADVVDPAALKATAAGVLRNGERIDLVYNRHCDFYLENPPMSGLREAYAAGRICLTPNPYVYGLLADKRRMTLWAMEEFADRLALPVEDGRLLQKLVPASRLLSDLDPEEAWTARRQSVFKPVARFGSRGVLVGEKLSRKRFDQLPPAETLVQELVPPSLTEVTGYPPMKTDFRVFAYRGRVLGVTARLYRGQVTNMRTEGGGFARVRLA